MSEGTTVAVTGGANGIGRAVAQQFAAAGARVTIGDVNAEAAAATARDIGVRGAALDVADEARFAAFLDDVESEQGPLDVLVNNAGIDWIGPFHEEPSSVSRREVEVNLLGTIYGTRLAMQRMLPRGRGHIVNVASGVGRVPLPGSSVYSATKHGIVGLTESLRLEYQHTPIRFSLIQPAQVETAMLDGQGRPKLLAQVSPDEVAAAILRAVRENRFEVWVPASQGLSAKLGNLLPRAARDRIMRALGVDRIAGDTDIEARRAYHERMFGRG